MRGKYGPHVFRHFFASWRISEGDNIKSVLGAHGPLEPTVTLNIYAHLLPDADQHERFAAGAAALVA
jgi:site-specific recombinase XerD